MYVKYLNEKYGPTAHIMQTTFFYGFLRLCVDVGGNQISDDMALSMQRVIPMIGDFTADIEATISNFIDNYPKKVRFKEIEQVSHEETVAPSGSATPFSRLDAVSTLVPSCSQRRLSVTS